MSITYELRKYANRFKNSHDAWSGIGDELTAIADRIDAEHEAKVAEVASGWDYWESTHVELPKDADGVPIRIGDVMEWPDGDDEPFEVVGIGENGTLFYMYDGSCEWTNAKYKVHHVPTVEDVLREMLDAWGELPSNATNEAIVAEYAKRLTLAEGEDA